MLVPDADGVAKALEVSLVVYSQDCKSLNWEIRNNLLQIKPGQ